MDNLPPFLEVELLFHLYIIDFIKKKYLFFISITGQLPDDWSLIKLLGACDG